MRHIFPNYYDDPQYDYQKYWEERDYENTSEKIALKKLFLEIPKRETIIDIGAGFGRLSPIYTPLFKKCFLVDPSTKMLKLAKNKYINTKNVNLKQACLDKLPFKDNSLDVGLIVRILHHCPDIPGAFAEISRILTPNGYLVMEFPNELHLKNILKSFFLGHKNLKKVSRYDLATNKEVPFFNYHPDYIMNNLLSNNFEIITTISVSNFRFKLIKKIIPLKYLIRLETLLQPIFTRFYLGPSIFLLAQKKS